MTEKKYDVIHIGEANHDIRVPDVPDDFLTGTVVPAVLPV